MGQEESQPQPDVVTGKQCNGDDEHYYEQVFFCDKTNCKSKICKKCIGKRT